MSESIEIEIRGATERDAKMLAEIQASACQAAFKAQFPGATMPEFDSLKKSQAYWRQAVSFAEPQVLVASVAREVLGFIGFDRSRDAKTPPTMGEIWAHYVQPKYWGKGLGLALWDGARDGLQEEGCTQVSAWVPLAYEQALRFYTLAGFKRNMSSIKTVLLGSTRMEQICFTRTLK